MMAGGRRLRILAMLLVALIVLFGWEWNQADLVAPSPSLLLVDRNGRFIANVAADPQYGNGYWPLQILPERVSQATLSLEDRRFWRHPGVDVLAMARAFVQNINAGRRTSGASTIAMQVARLQDPKPRTYVNKLREVVRAVFLTMRHGRALVLAHYLRLVPYGNNSHGIAHAARIYLDKPVADLSWAEIAFLSALPQAPSLMNPFNLDGRKRAIKRGLRMLANLRDDGVIGAVDYDLAVSQISRLSVLPKPHRDPLLLHAIMEMSKDLPPLIPQGGRVETSLDLDVQKTVARLMTDVMEEWRTKGAQQAAVLVTDVKTGEILSWVGSAEYFSANAGAMDFVRTPRSPGSTLKPFIYALALERGTITPATVVDDLVDRAKGFRNSDRRFLGPMLPRQALANSRNVPAVGLLDQVGVEETFLHFQNIGLIKSSAATPDVGLDLAIGSIPTTMKNLVRAYSALANDGVAAPQSWLKGKDLSGGTRLMSTDTARLINSFLSDRQARLPSFPRMGATEFNFPVAVKTGTSQGYRDAWTLAYSQRYVVGVWVGRPDAKAMNRLSGAGSATVLAGDILKSLHPHQVSGLEDRAFPMPEGYENVELCTRTGKRNRGFCDTVLAEWMPTSKLPEQDDSYGVLAVDGRNNLRATVWTPKAYIKTRKFVTLAPRYMAWAATNKLPIAPTTFSPLDVPKGYAVSAVMASPRLGEGVELVITSPSNGMQLTTLPDSAPSQRLLILRGRVGSASKYVMWYVDELPFRVVEAPYDVKWPIRLGRHSFQMGLPGTEQRSAPVIIWVE